jgi:acyl-homoserine-lactone acylase
VLAQTVTTDKLAWLTPSARMKTCRWPKPTSCKASNSTDRSRPGELSNASQQLAAESARRQHLEQLGHRPATQPQRQEPAGQRQSWALGRAVAVDLRADPRTEIPGRRCHHCRFADGARRLQRQSAWSATSVLGDNQDLFLEKIKRQGNSLTYEVNGKWQPLGVRNETYFVKGQRPIREAVYETRHALLNSAQARHRATVSAWPCKPRASPTTNPGRFFDLTRAQNVERASDASREIRAIALNMVFADASNIGWQVTGRFPNRREGEGLLPSPGWEGRYDWDGYADRCCTLRSGPGPGLARHRQPASSPATACSCPTPGRRRSAANVWRNWPTAASMTVAA